MTEEQLTKILKPYGLCAICWKKKTSIYDYCGQWVDDIPKHVSKIEENKAVALGEWFKKKQKQIRIELKEKNKNEKIQYESKKS